MSTSCVKNKKFQTLIYLYNGVDRKTGFSNWRRIWNRTGSLSGKVHYITRLAGFEFESVSSQSQTNWAHCCSVQCYTHTYRIRVRRILKQKIGSANFFHNWTSRTKDQFNGRAYILCMLVHIMFPKVCNPTIRSVV